MTPIRSDAPLGLHSEPSDFAFAERVGRVLWVAMIPTSVGTLAVLALANDFEPGHWAVIAAGWPCRY